MTARTADRTYQRNRRRLKNSTDICWICGQWINPDLHFPHPMSFSADHVTPIGRGGHNHGELRAAHLRCNQQRKTTPPPAPHARTW